MKLYKYKEYPDESDGHDAYVLGSTGNGKTWQTLLLCLKMLAPSTTEKSVAALNDSQSTPEHPASESGAGQSKDYYGSTNLLDAPKVENVNKICA